MQMNKRFVLKCLSVVMAVCILFSAVPFNSAFAAPQNTASLDSQRAELEKNLKAVEKKLRELGSQSKETEEYISVLDEKIKYLHQQFQLAKEETQKIESKVSKLEQNIDNNESEMLSISAEVVKLEKDITVYTKQFDATYQAYCNRIRALYISGDQTGTLAFLLTSDGISNLLTRYEMVKAVSANDKKLLERVEQQTQKMIALKNELDARNKNLIKTQEVLKKDKSSLKTEKANLLQKQEELAVQQSNIEEQQKEANSLLKKLNDKTKEYGEYRDITQEELDEIDAAIEEADRKYAQSTTTTTAPKPSASDDKHDGDTPAAEKSTTTNHNNSNYISLTYPCPAYTKITCGFGAYSGHTGCDFSTHGNYNQKIVAAESGTVIISTDLKNSDGSYRSYGRYIVIRHDKTTSSGKTVYTLYAHNNSRLVSEGQHVSKGQQIAKSGSTGNSTGPHCHFEVRVGGSSQSYAVNPQLYLP